MKKSSCFALLCLFSICSFAQRFDPNNINDKLFIAINCVGISESTTKMGANREVEQEKYNKFYIIDTESKLGILVKPNEVNPLSVSTATWTITPKKVIGHTDKKNDASSLVMNFEYDRASGAFEESFVVTGERSVLTSKTKGFCSKFKAIPR